MVQLDEQTVPTQYCENCDLDFTLLDEYENVLEAYFCPSCGMNIEEDEDEDDDPGFEDY